MTPEQIAWAAGLFEGEGTIVHFRHTEADRSGYRKWKRGLQLGMADEDVVRRFHETVGVGRVRMQRRGKPHHADIWIWSVSRWADLEPLLRSLLPHFGDRRAEAAMALLANPPSRCHRHDDSTCAHGHPLSGDNLYISPRGRKVCRRCQADAQRRYRQKERVP